jgi:hypothetical protein
MKEDSLIINLPLRVQLVQPLQNVLYMTKLSYVCSC